MKRRFGRRATFSASTIYNSINRFKGPQLRPFFVCEFGMSIDYRSRAVKVAVNVSLTKTTKRFKDKVRQITSRSWEISMEDRCPKINGMKTDLSCESADEVCFL